MPVPTLSITVNGEAGPVASVTLALAAGLSVPDAQALAVRVAAAAVGEAVAAGPGAPGPFTASPYPDVKASPAKATAG